MRENIKRNAHEREEMCVCWEEGEEEDDEKKKMVKEGVE